MAVVESRSNLWEVLAGRAPGIPLSSGDEDLYRRIVERLNPARAKPKLRSGIEDARLVSARGEPYVMLRSPDRRASYARITADELALSALMDGTRTVTALLVEFTKISGRLAPDQVTRLVADLASNRMLEELPIDAFHPVTKIYRAPFPVRIGKSISAAARGRRMGLVNVDPILNFIYRFGGRLLFTRVAVVFMALVAISGFGVFVYRWIGGAQSAFVVQGSYAKGGILLLGLNLAALLSHELGHGLAAKHAGRKVPTAGVLLYFGIPSVFVDTTDVWMAGRKARILTSAAGPFGALTMAGAISLVSLLRPELAPLAFKLSFLWYLNSLFNLNPLFALDGYYMLMDWLEVPNLRARGLVTFFTRIIRGVIGWKGLRGETRLLAMYGTAASLWLVFSMFLGVRMYKDRLGGLFAGLWNSGLPARVLLVAFVAGLFSPVAHALLARIGRKIGRAGERLQERKRDADLPRRLDALRASRLGGLPAEALAALAEDARWIRTRRGAVVIEAGAPPPGIVVVIEGVLEARKPGDPPGTIRARAVAGEVAGFAPAFRGTESALDWSAVGTKLLIIPAESFRNAAGHLVTTPQPEQAEAATLLELPAFEGLSEEAKMAMSGKMNPFDLSPGQAISGDNPNRAAVVASGIMALDDGSELHRGDLIGPPEEGSRIRATARTAARLWSLPAIGGLGLLLSAANARLSFVPIAGVGSKTGVHGEESYPPLNLPWGSPPYDGDGSADRSMGRWFSRLIALLILLVLLALLISWPPGNAWAEIPDDQILLTVLEGRATVEKETDAVLEKGDLTIVGQGDSVVVHTDSLARFTYRGGAESTLCPRTLIRVGKVRTIPGVQYAPLATLGLERGRIVTETASKRDTFAPLELAVVTPMDLSIRNVGDARFAAGRAGARVEHGTVHVNDRLLRPRRGRLGCGGPGLMTIGELFTRPSPSPPAPSEPVPSPPLEESLEPEPSPSPSPKPSPSPTPSPSPKEPLPSLSPPPTPAPDFQFTCRPSTVSRSSTITCAFEYLNGFADPIDLTCVWPRDSYGTCSGARITPPETIVEFQFTGSPIRVCQRFDIVASGGGVTKSFSMHYCPPE